MRLPNESKLYWQIKDPGSAAGVFLNKYRISKNVLIRLNDGDIIGIGGNFKEEDIRRSKSLKSYLFQVVAPEDWGRQPSPDESSNDTNEDSKVTPPQSDSGEESGDLLELLDKNKKVKKKKTTRIIKKEPEDKPAKKVHRTDLVKKIMKNPNVPKVLLEKLKSHPKSKRARIHPNSNQIIKWITHSDQEESIGNVQLSFRLMFILYAWWCFNSFNSSVYLIFDKIHIFKITCLEKFTFSKYYFSQNSQFQAPNFHKIHISKITYANTKFQSIFGIFPQCECAYKLKYFIPDCQIK